MHSSTHTCSDTHQGLNMWFSVKVLSLTNFEILQNGKQQPVRSSHLLWIVMLELGSGR